MGQGMSTGLRNTLAVIAFVIAFFWAAASAESKPSHIAVLQARAKPIICKVFGPHCADALNVSWCESRHYKWAVNGQYRGLFQVSEHWRRTVPGWAPGAWAQARHAYRVFKLTGSNWSHWQCRPDGGLRW
jgi:hypothetical protein